MGPIISTIITICIVLVLRNYKSKWKYRLKISRIKAGNTAQFFDNYFIEPRNFYIAVFNTMPCVGYIENVDINKLFDLVKTNKYGNVLESFQRIYHNWNDDAVRFSKTFFVLENKIVI